MGKRILHENNDEERKFTRSSLNDQMLDSYVKTINASTKGRTTPRQVQKIVPIEDWLRSDYHIGDEAERIYPYWEDVLITYFKGDHEREGLANYREMVLTGSIGTGKGYALALALLRSVYVLTCFDHPQLFFGLSLSKPINYVYLSVSLDVTELTGFLQIRNIIGGSPYFKEVVGWRRELRSRIQFESRCVVITQGSGSNHIRGTDLFGAAFDEANYTKPGANSHLRYEAAQKTYTDMCNRRASRFQLDGKLFGFSGIASSSETQSSFVERRIAESKKAKTSDTLVIEARLWDVRPERFSLKTFFVFKGNEFMAPTLMNQMVRGKCEDDESCVGTYLEAMGIETEERTVQAIAAAFPNDFAEVPIDFYDAFERNIERALKDIAGVPLGGVRGLPIVRDKYRECFKTDRDHPFTRETITLSTADTVLIQHYVRNSQLSPVPESLLFIHVDASETGDATGIAGVHRETVRGQAESDSVYIIDFMLRIEPPHLPARISISKIRTFIVWLRRERKFQIGRVTMDRYGSAETIQELNAKGIKSKLQSVDRTDDPYLTLVNVINEGRLYGYFYKPFDTELWSVQYDRVRRKIYRSSGGSKDVADAVAGALFSAVTHYAARPSGFSINELAALNRCRPTHRESEFQFVVDDYEKAEGGRITGIDSGYLSQSPIVPRRIRSRHHSDAGLARQKAASPAKSRLSEDYVMLTALMLGRHR